MRPSVTTFDNTLYVYSHNIFILQFQKLHQSILLSNQTNLNITRMVHCDRLILMYVQTQDNKKPVTNELAAKHVTVYRNTD